jgi:hypothetical protein
VIASSLTYRGEVSDVDKGLLRSPWRLARVRDHTISILMREIEQTLRETLDPHGRRILLIHPPLSGLNTFDLSISGDRKAAAIAAAQAQALADIAAFRNLGGW